MLKHQQIRHALALLELGNFRKAAHAQHISQPAFSRSIAALEESLGVKLFHRHPSGVTPTVYGEILKEYGREMIVAVSELQREIRILQGLETGELSVAAGPYPAEISAHRAVGRLLTSYPELRCKITVSDWHKVERLVLTQAADIGLAEVSAVEKIRDLDIEIVGRHRFIFYCRPGHPLLQMKTINRDDIDQYPLVLIKPPGRLLDVLPGKLVYDEKSEYLAPSIEVNTLGYSRQIVAQSDAVSAAAPVQIRNELGKGLFVVIPFSAEWMTLNYGFISVKERALSPVTKRFMACVREIEAHMDMLNQVLMEKFLPT